MKLFNFLTRKIETFKPLKKGRIGLYTCGPTVYNYLHIGNYRTYIFEDVLRRVLEMSGYRVRHVMNITDVGHLVGDNDVGEDKLELEARKEKQSVWDIAKFYTKSFLIDIKKINVKKAQVLSPATKNVKEQIKLIRILLKKGAAYETETAVYFDVSKFRTYAKYSRQPVGSLKIGVREGVVVDSQKKHPADFALWFKLVGKFKNHVMRWNSPWGAGFPGWHIECSAISTKYLGQPFDIHTGGVDHIFPHHTNEIAQSEAAYGKPLAKYWIEGEHLLVDGKKMSKSLGNVYRLSDLEARGFDPLALRYLVLTSHYRSKLNFTWKSLEAAQNALEKIRSRVLTPINPSFLPLNPLSFFNPLFRRQFQKAIFNDLGTPKALAVFWKYFDKLSLADIFWADKFLGLNLSALKPLNPPVKIKKLAGEREKARAAKDWKKADEIRAQIREFGWKIEDSPKGPIIRPIISL